MKHIGEKPYSIGLLGLDFESGNLGCGALSYGFVEILGKINRYFAKKQILLQVLR